MIPTKEWKTYLPKEAIESKKIQRINIHYYPLLKCGADPIALFGSTAKFNIHYQRYSLSELEVLNKNDERKLAEIGLTIADIVRIYNL